MRMYRKRFLARNRQQDIERHRETRDGIIWSVDTSTRTVEVRVQGSDTTITAYFPENWYSPPEWCKYGNPVKIMHTGGVRSRIEVIGPGLVAPYPQSGNIWPTDPLEEDAIVEGLDLMAMPNNPAWRVMVSTGTIRISGTEYDVDAIAMDDGDYWYMGDGGYMDNVAAVLYAGTKPTGLTYPSWGYKIHSVQIDSDLAFSVVEDDQFEAYNTPVPGYIYFTLLGTTQSSLSPLPIADVPSGSLEIGTILHYEETYTEIQQYLLNYQLCNTYPYPRFGRYPARLEITIDDVVMPWGTSETDIEVICYDNLNAWFYCPMLYLEASVESGNGELLANTYPEEAAAGYDTTVKSLEEYNTSPSYPIPRWQFKYKRGGLVTDESPVLQFKLLTNVEIITRAAITLLDAAGDPMYS